MCNIVFSPNFDKPGHLSSGEPYYGEITIYGEYNSYFAHSDYLTYAITDLTQTDDYSYTFVGQCIDESMAPKQKSRRKNKSEEPQYIGILQDMSVSFDPETACYNLNLGRCPLSGTPEENVIVSLPSGLSRDEARTVPYSVLSPYIGKTKLYPAKYLGDWVAEYEWVILSAIAVMMLLALVMGDVLSFIALPVMTYLSLYTSWMVMLPCMPFLIFIPLSYIPLFKDETEVPMFAYIGTFLLGLYLLYYIYIGSTLWNTLLLAVVWCVGLGGFICILLKWCYSENRKCKHCGHQIHRCRYSESYYDAVRQRISDYTPTKDRDEFEIPASFREYKTKNKECVCFTCDIKKGF